MMIGGIRTEKAQTRTVESRTIEVRAFELSRCRRKRREIVSLPEKLSNAEDPKHAHHLDHVDLLRFEFAVFS